ncbi:flagellar biosynthetic protein FliR [Bacillus oleivorans]|uniref:Flagellar biosynthetic protein FliR n=1 Tax=Bacillus oleivorans TaxID=1448271 RepID=A0A285D1H4_9BACI|nr:flagellar biosynthetic protein FliR [Bacillus oleivorans]SNX73687.1 flagellar biosynthetic protein FliR [Bacillus oleivorans]
MIELIPGIPAFLLIFIRVTTFFLVVPLYSYRTIPSTHKVGFSLFLSWIMYYTIDKPADVLTEHFFLVLIKEVLFGLLLGLIAFIILAAIQVAGGFIDFQMGFAIANVIDPQTGAQSPLMGQYFYIIALLFLLAVDGHHLLLDAIFYSYEFVPLEQLSLPLGSQELALFVTKAFASMFLIAFQMSLPVVACLFLIDVALGITARTVPQLNVFVVGLPLKIAVSFIFIIITFGGLMVVVSSLFDQMFFTMRGLMELLSS